MKYLIASLVALAACFNALSQPVPPVAASQAQVDAGTAGWPFVVTPQTLGLFPFVATNLSSATMTNVANAKANTASNNIMGYIGTATNLVLLSGSNGPPVVGGALVFTGTNASGGAVVKSTNWPAGGGTGTLLPPNASGVLTNDGSGNTNWSTSITGAWIGTGTLPLTAADTTWMPVTNAVAVTNFPVASRTGQVPRMTMGTNQFGAPTAVITNLLMGDLEYHVNTNAFTNIVIGTIGPLTNKDGLVFYIPIGTNAP